MQAEREGIEARANADDDEAGKATKRSAESLKAADKLLEALTLVIEEDAKGPGNAGCDLLLCCLLALTFAVDAPVNPIFLAFRVKTGLDYLRHTLETVPSRWVGAATCFKGVPETGFAGDWVRWRLGWHTHPK